MRDYETCKRCGWEACTKNGLHRNQQRYRCPKCDFNFVLGDKRVKPGLELRKALAAFFAANSENASATSIRKYLGLSRTDMERHNARMNKANPEYARSCAMKESSGLTCDQVTAYIHASRSFLAGQKRWLVAQGELFPGYEAIVILRPKRMKAAKAPS